MRLTRLSRAALALLLAAPGVVWAAAAPNALRAEVERIQNGKVQLHFTARPGVYGDGHSMSINHNGGRRSRNGDWCSRCTNGPVFVEMTLRQGEVERLDQCVGGEMRTRAGVTDLGEIAPPVAAEFFVALAATADSDVGEEAVSAAALADSVVLWPQLVQLARNRHLATDVRKQALFWVGQAAGESITKTLDGFSRDDDEEVELRKAAVFALSQRPRPEAVPALMRIARSKVHPEVRRAAFFWLAQFDEPGVADFFEAILVGK